MPKLCLIAMLFLSCVLAGQEAAAQAPTVVEYNQRGIDALDAGAYEDAITYFEQAMILAPDNVVLQGNYTNALRAAADALAQKGQMEEGIIYLETALYVEPDNFAALLQLGSYHLHRNQIQAAIDRLEAALGNKPGDLDAHEMLGQAYYLDNDLPSARAQWEYVLEMDPDRPNLLDRYEKAFREEVVEADFHRRSSRHFQITYPHGVPNHLRSSILTILERAYMDIGRRFNGVYPEAPIHVIAYTAEQFSEATQLDEHVGAVYDGKIRIPLTDAENQFHPDVELTRRLVHEYVHVVVREVAGERVPWWLNEGLAETLSKDLNPNQTRTLSQAYAEGTVHDFHALEIHQLKALEAEPLRIAYLQSHAAVSLLWHQYGNRRVLMMLNDIAEGMPPEESLMRHFRKNYDNLEAELAQIYAQ